MLLLLAVGATRGRANILDPSNTALFGSIAAPTLTSGGTYTFNTDSTNANPTLTGTGIGTINGTFVNGVAVFDFVSLNMPTGTYSFTATSNDPLALLSQGTLTMNGTIDLSGGTSTTASGGTAVAGAGSGGNGPHNTLSSGSGPGGGTGSSSSGGGGGGFGGAGGTGSSSGGPGGSAYGNLLTTLQGGSGGGGGGLNNGNHGGGGAGGGAIEIGAVGAITIGGTVNANGGNGDTTGGGGGGSGGGIFIHSGTVNTVTNSVSGGTVTLNNSAVLEVNGGTGNTSGSGGGGGGGQILILADSYTQGSATLSAMLGAGSAAGSNGQVLTPTTATPEPSSFVLLGLMGGGFLIVRRWRCIRLPVEPKSN
jgi:hypothetical protein